MSSYKELSNEDKIAAILDGNFRHSELCTAEPYLAALMENDRAVMRNWWLFTGRDG